MKLGTKWIYSIIMVVVMVVGDGFFASFFRSNLFKLKKLHSLHTCIYIIFTATVGLYELGPRIESVQDEE